jgi:hypothetical protein
VALGHTDGVTGTTVVTSGNGNDLFAVDAAGSVAEFRNFGLDRGDRLDLSAFLPNHALGDVEVAHTNGDSVFTFHGAASATSVITLKGLTVGLADLQGHGVLIT